MTLDIYPTGHRRFRPTAVALVVLLLALSYLPVTAMRAAAAGQTLNVVPDVQESTVNTTTSLTAEISPAADPAGVEIDFELFGGPNNDDGDTTASPDISCTIPSGASSCTISYFGTGGTGTDRIRAWIDTGKNAAFEGDATEGRDEVADPGSTAEDDGTDVVEISWNAGTIPVVKNLDCEPESSPSKPAAGSNAEQTFTCTAIAPVPAGSPPGTLGPPVPGVTVDGENMSGPNDPDNSAGGGPDYNDACTTGADGSCVVHIVPTEGESGNANICFWADYPVPNAAFNPAGVNSDDGGDCDNETPTQNDADRTDTVIARWLAISNLTLAPATGTVAAGTPQPIVATLKISGSDATPVPGVPIIFTGGPTNDAVDSATTDGAGQAGFTYTGTIVGTDTVTAFADLNDNSVGDPFEPQATGSRTWTPAGLGRVDCTPEASTRPVSLAGSSQQTITCNVSDAFGNQLTAGTPIDLELAGPNDPDDGAAAGTADVDNFCSTSALGTCSGVISATEIQAGTATVCLWADIDGNNVFDPAGSPADGGGCGEGPDGTDDNLADVVLVTWAPGAAAKLNCEPDSAASPPNGPGSNRTYTCSARDANDNLVGAGVRIDGENLGGANDPDHSDGKGAAGAANTTPDWNNFCLTGPDGACTGAISTAGEIGSAQICFWIDPVSSVDNRFSISGAEADGGACDSDPIPPAADNANATDIVLSSWELRRPSALVLPSSEGTAFIGEGFTFTATLTDQFGGPVPGGTVRFRLSGTNDLSLTAKTDGDGHASITYGSKKTGSDTIVAYADLNDNGTNDGEPGGSQVVNWREATPASGYWLVANDGGIFAYGSAGFYGSTGNLRLAKPIVGMAATASGQGYWLVASDGGIFAYGDAGFYGSTGNLRLAQPIVGMAATASGKGYWLVAADGGIFAFGDAKFHGSTGNLKLAKPIVGMVPTTGDGYWLVASDGGIFAFGDARFFGSTGNIRLAKPIVGMTRTATSDGYWLVASDGGIFAFGDARFFGSTGNVRLAQPIVAVSTTLTGNGYWLVAADGGIFSYGDATFYGSTGNIKLAKPIVGMAPKR